MAIFLMTIQVSGQVYTNKLVGAKNLGLKDSLEKQAYPYALPIWGKKAAAKGYQLPYSAGISVNYLWQESELVIDDLMVGFNGGEMHSLDEPVFTFVFGPRVGKTFKFKNPDMNIAGWVGAFRLNYSAATSGSINLADLFPSGELQAKVTQGFEKVNETSMQVETWWSNLTPVEQKNPINKSKYDAANKALAKASGVLTAADGALKDGKSSTVEYSLDKTLKNKWNFIIGTQFQINGHLMLRAEYGFLGTRQQFIGG